MSLIVPKGQMEVRKSEALLNARYQLGELALKLISIIYSNVKRSDEVSKRYEIRVADIAKMMNKDYGEIYNLLDKATDEMLKNPLKIVIGEDKKGKKEWEKFNWISYAKYKDGIITFSVSQELKPYILELQQKFVKYRLENILNLKGVYIIRLYEILKDIFNKETRKYKKAEIIYRVNELREKLEIPKSYQYSSGIKLRILEKAKSEFAEHTDIIFDYEEIKTGRKVTHLRFIIYPNPAKIVAENNKKSERIFKNRSAFVAFLRQNYAGTGKAFGYRTIDGKVWWLKIDKKGLLYGSPGAITLDEINNLASLTKEFNSVESGELYDLWFKVAQNSDLYKDFITQGFCLYEIWKKNKELYLELQKDIILLQEQGII